MRFKDMPKLGIVILELTALIALCFATTENSSSSSMSTTEPTSPTTNTDITTEPFIQHGNWSNWKCCDHYNGHEKCCDAAPCQNDNQAACRRIRKRMCNNPAPTGPFARECSMTDGTFGLYEEQTASMIPINKCQCAPVDGGWSQWATHPFKGTCCANNGRQWELRWCREPEPAWGGKLCLKKDKKTMSNYEEFWKSCTCDWDQERADEKFAEWDKAIDQAAAVPLNNWAFTLLMFVLGIAVVALDYIQ